jgi:hypothetical protein
MTNGATAARRALGRGATAEALVHLWNELEPARLSGDRGRLNMLARLAEEVRQRGDEADRHEAERLLRELREQAEAPEAAAPATAVLGAEVTRAGGDGATGRGGGGDAEVEAEAEPPEQAGSPLGGLANWLWLVFVLLIVLANVLGQLRD